MFDAIILTAVLGALFGLVLAVASRRLHIETDLRIAAITALLPGANCGACGFPGCSALAEAIAAGTAKTNACAVADAAAKNKIAAIMNHDGEEEASGPQMAALACNGCAGNVTIKYSYNGPRDCRLAASLLAAPGKCNYACLGLGTCAQNCPFNAISPGANGLPVIDTSKCTGCGLCTQNCPQGVLHLVPRSSTLRLLCSNRANAKEAMAACKASCIGCGLCARTCPNNAIIMEGNLPKIDYAKCTGCGLCAQKCPRGCLVLVTAPQGEAPEARSKTKGCAACPLAESCGVK